MLNPWKHTEALKQVISEEKAKLEAHAAKYKSKIRALEKEEAEQSAFIEASMTEIVSLEDVGDIKAAEKLRLKVRDSRLKVEDLRSEIAVYRKQVDGYPADLMNAAVKKVQKAAKAAEEQRQSKYKAARDEREALEKQINELEARIQDLTPHVQFMGDDATIDALKPFISSLDDRFAKLDFYKQKEYVRKWMSGGSVDSLFKPAAEWKGVTQTFGEGHTYLDRDGNIVATSENNRRYL